MAAEKHHWMTCLMSTSVDAEGPDAEYGLNAGQTEGTTIHVGRHENHDSMLKAHPLPGVKI